VHLFAGYGPRSRVLLPRVTSAWRKGGDDKDNPLHISGEIKDWPTFKEAIQSRADARDTTWLLEAGRALAMFFDRQIKDKTGSVASRKCDRKNALDREKVSTDSNHVPTSVDAYTDRALREWFDDRDLATELQLSLNKNRLASMVIRDFNLFEIFRGRRGVRQRPLF
jgi:hypothetical protein